MVNYKGLFMKIIQVCIFTLTFFTINLAVADNFSEEKNKNSHQASSKSIFESEKCKRLRGKLESLDQEILKRKEKICDLDVRSVDLQPMFLIGLMTAFIIPSVGIVLMGAAGTGEIYYIYKDHSIIKHKSHIALMKTERFSVIQECKKYECSDI